MSELNEDPNFSIIDEENAIEIQGSDMNESQEHIFIKILSFCALLESLWALAANGSSGAHMGDNSRANIGYTYLHRYKVLLYIAHSQNLQVLIAWWLQLSEYDAQSS
jgi:alpha-D-ribose 1-methylphosphonate 5-triphosphate synthase subunit PhnL